ncbi:HNH endonuclease [Galbibacter sp. BG1]|uniref:HNH endonuclease n=1 Tax=Galbibacter sp. BG1 TaxID=1170699 RepID=UPI0015BB4137|nr:HNH endonuclease signature motif containing protein [Galbibacter sp. BG1]QLE02899.1 HNH endonuclease [Galbibacter sp. BG1]
MPNRPKKIKRNWKPDRKAFDRAISDYDFYNSSSWRKVSKRYKDNNPLCVKCLEEDNITPAEVTDHIVRIKDGGSKFSEDNLQSLCHFHHNQKSGKEAHGYKEGRGINHEKQ